MTDLSMIASYGLHPEWVEDRDGHNILALRLEDVIAALKELPVKEAHRG
jgi:hypothetical protein